MRYRTMVDEVERRFYTGETRVKVEEERNLLVGYAAVFDKLSENLGGFREVIAPGAFDNVLEDDVRALFNHDPSAILGRTKSSTLSISVDETGLRYSIRLADTQLASDVLEMINRGDVDGSSFAFRIAPNGDEFSEDEDGRIIRTVTNIQRLFDVGPVTFPAFPDTANVQRSIELFKSKNSCNTNFNDLRLKVNKVSL